MSDPSKVERITRSLAFMLRHQPEKFDLEIDAFGYGDVDEVVRALNERLGERVVIEDVEEAVESGDRQRYEIQGDRIRALYGHSIPVEPGDASKPPEMLYVAIPTRDVDRARRFGLRGGRRRFLHLALSSDDARESGRRIAQEYTVMAVQAMDAWEEGVNFFDRKSLWLAEEVPTHLLEVEESFEDGTPPERERHDGRGRRPERGRGRGCGRGGRRDERGSRDSRGGDRDRDRDRSQDRDDSRGRGRPDADRGGRREERSRPPERAESKPRGPREESRDIPRPERRESEERPARRQRASRSEEGTSSFGAGLESAPKSEPAVSAAPEKPAPKPAKKPEPEPEREQREDSSPGFGAGL